jgi:hypothetical protein
MTRIAMPDIIVLLPGILGSALEKDGKEIWGLSAGSAVRAVASLGGSIKELQLRDEPDKDVDIWEGVTAPRLLPDVHMVPGLWKIDGYTKIATYIKKVFDVTPGQNYFEFPYDWRLPNRVAALRLKRMAKEWLRNWRRDRQPDGRLILMGHSMGGLVARYFLEVLGGWEITRTLITFGTPHRGSLNAVNFIANGWRKTVLSVEVLNLSNLLRSLPSVYELLPIYKCCVDGGELKYLRDVQIPHLDLERLKRAADFHNAILKGVKDRGKQFDEYVHPVVGTLQPTLQSARLQNGVVEMFNHINGQDMGGDGTVPRVSATPIELSDAGRDMFAADRHASLQNNDAVWAQVQGILQTGQINLGAFKVPLVQLSVQLDDAYSLDEPVRLRARSDQIEPPPLSARITSIENMSTQTVKLTPAADGWHEVETPPLSAGTYRVTVYGDVRVQPVTDVFTVA